MTPNHGNGTEMLATPAEPLSTAVELARLTGKVEQVIGDHERRITALENQRNGAGLKAAAIISPIIAACAFLAILADKVQWQ